MLPTNNKTVILIPHYNNLSGLFKSIKSIFHPKGIDILVIDDGSLEENKPTLSHLKSIININVNIEIISLPENKGITEALNYGLSYIIKKDSYQYIARIDCGDTCVINRFRLQEEFMQQNKDISLVGSWVKWICNSSKKELFSYKPPSDHKAIRRKMAIRCNIIHPSVMYRTSIVKEIGTYPHKFDAAEDYAYFFEIAKNSKTANIPKFLTTTEHNINGISQENKRLQNKSKLKVVMRYARKDVYFIYGICFNLALILIPQKLVQRIKFHLR